MMDAGNAGQSFTIGKLSKASGVNIETIRYYERIGLLPAPPRSQSGYRQYAMQHLQLLRFIRRGRELGFSLDDIRSLLALQVGGLACGEVQVMTQKHIAELDQRMAGMQRLRDQLADLERQCAGGAAQHCPVIEDLLGD